MVNKVILVGRLGKDPELRMTQSGKQTCRFSIATDSGFGESKRTDWHNIVVWDKAAENCARYLRKGSMVFVDGRLRYDKYEKDGVIRYTTDIVANSVQFLSARNESAGNFESPMPSFSDNFPSSAPQSNSSGPALNGAFGGGFNDDEIPF